MTLNAMSILAGLLVSACQKGSSLEQFSKQVEAAKSIRAEASFKVGSQSRPVSIIRKLPNAAKTTSQDLVVLVTDKDGWLEIDHAANKYATVPWGGKFFPGIGKLVAPPITSCLFAYGASPFKIAPAKEWKLTKKGGNDVWTAIVQSQLGPQTFEVELGSGNELKRYLTPDGEFLISKWELDPSIADSEFSLTVPDGFVMLSLPIEMMSMYAGQKLDLSKMKDNGKGKLGSEWSLVLFSDPEDRISTEMRKWLSKTSLRAAKVEVSLGTGGDYSATDSKLFWEMVSATPTCALVGKDGSIRALWQGFDPAQTSKLEKEISEAMKEHS